MSTDATITPLIESELACSVCGIAVPRTEAIERGIETARSFGRERLPGAIVVRNDPSAREFETKMTRCASCAKSMDLAVQLAAQHPGPIPLGSFTYSGAKSVEVIVNALAVLAAAGERIEISEAHELRQLTEIFAQLGARLTWRSRFVPHAYVDAHTSTAAARPFAHVAPELLEEAQAAVLWLRVLRAERPSKLLPPIGAGCYPCGVGYIEALPSRRAAAGRIERVSPTQLGGRGDDRLEAAICGQCANARGSEKALGLGYVERLVLDVAGITRMLGDRDLRLNGVRAWGALGMKQPKAERFGHLDLAGLQQQVQSGRTFR